MKIKYLIFLIFLVSGCATQSNIQATERTQQEGISKIEAESVASSWAEGLDEGDAQILSSYIEGDYWKVQVSLYSPELGRDSSSFLEINSRTGVLECIGDEFGFRDCY